MNYAWLWLLAQASTGNQTPARFEQLLDCFNTNPVTGWVIAIFAMVTTAAVSVAVLTGNLDKIFGFVDKYRPKKREISQEDRDRLRRDLIDVVLGQVVTRLEASLHHKIRLDLKRQEERQRVGQRDLPTVETNDLAPTIRHEINPFATPAPSTPVDATTSTASLLARDDIQGKLLILGEPGAGKTNELLALAKTLLQQAKTSPDAPIPVTFELSEWSGGPDKTFADWLCEQLQDKYTVPIAVAKDWIEHNQLIPLLDGLDELRRVDEAEIATDAELDQKRQAKQIQCVRAINEFLDLYPATSTVVCCRRKEYEALEAQGEYLKRLNGAIYLKALNDEQIHTYFEASNRGPLWDTVKNQPELLELARSPLFLLMLVVAYQGQPIHNTGQLLDLYIENQLNDLNNQEAYPPGKAPSKEQTDHYLAWLATKLEKEEVTEFLIERLQPSWLDRERDHRFYRRFYRLIFGLVVGLISGLIFGQAFGLIFGLFGGLSVGLFFWLTSKQRNIESAENLGFAWRKGLLYGIILGLLVGLIYGLLGGLSFGLLYGLLYGLGFGLSFGLITSEVEINDKQLPNQGIKASIKTALLGGLLVGLLFGLSSGLLVGLVYGLFGGLLVGLLFGLSSGWSSVIKHCCLRFALYRSGASPWNYAKFLEHAENHRFIQRVGGRYRFVHDLLRKRFAARYQPRYR